MIKLIIAEENQSYVQALTQYLLKVHGQALEIASFTQPLILQEHLNKGEAADILLIGTMLLSGLTNMDKIKLVIPLTNLEVNENNTAIYKYQKADKIAEQILELCDKFLDGKVNMIKIKSGCRIISVYSPTGATGKTTVAYNLAHQYALQGQKVLFVSLEAYSALPVFNISMNGKGLIYLLHLFKNNHSNLQLKLNACKIVDSNTNIHFIQREANILEYKDIKIEDIRHLTEFFKNSSSYDVVILDLDSGINETVLGVFKYCDVIINLLGNHSFNGSKWEDFNRQVPKINDLIGVNILEKLINICNKLSAEDSGNIQVCNGLEIKLQIPFINYSAIKTGAYFPEMTYYKQLYDITNIFFNKGVAKWQQ